MRAGRLDIWYQATDRKCHNWILMCGGWREAVDDTNFIGVAGGTEYLCQCRKIIIVRCTQIQTAK